MDTSDTKSKIVNAMISADFVRRVATRLQESAAAYLEAMTNENRPIIEIGGYYITFDGSMVYLARRANKCRCPACSGSSGGASPIGTLFGMAIFNSQTTATQEEVGHQDETDDEDAHYIGVVLKGGHNISNLPGEKAGEGMAYDKNGFTIIRIPTTTIITIPLQPVSWHLWD